MTESLPKLTHALLDLPGISHGFFTRQGGVSGFPYESLNVGQGSKDAPENVLENRRRVAACFGQDERQLLSLYQVHSATALRVDSPWPSPDARPEADGLVSTTAGLILGALSADCAPLLFADSQARIVAACHAGWKGALYGIIESTLDQMTNAGADLDNIHCVIGPCIAQASYEVSHDYETEFRREDPDSKAYFAEGHSPDKWHFDLPGYCLMRLKRAGVVTCASLGRDTCAEEALFFSNRRAFKRAEPDYGRLISAIMIDPEK